MKTYEVILDLTIGVSVEVDADNESQAEAIAMEKVRQNMSYYVSRTGTLVETQVYETNEVKD